MKLSKILRIISWILPVVILYFIYKKIDIQQLLQILKSTNFFIVILGFLTYPLLIFIGAWRWKIMLKLFSNTKYPYLFLLKHYWIGLSLGFFAPASIGWDVYRIVVCGKKDNSYYNQVLTIAFEKILALLSIASIILITYNFVNIELNSVLNNIIKVSYYLVIISIPIIFIVFRKRTFINNVLKKIISGLLKKAHLNISYKNIESLNLPSKKIIKISLVIILLSFLIQIVSSLGTQIFFNSIGYKIPFFVNLFVSPLLFFVFLLFYKLLFLH